MSETANQKPQSQDQASEDKPQSLTVTHPIFHQVLVLNLGIIVNLNELWSVVTHLMIN